MSMRMRERMRMRMSIIVSGIDEDEMVWYGWYRW